MEELVYRPIELNVSFKKYFEVMFDAMKLNKSMSQHVSDILNNQVETNDLDSDSLSLFRELASYGQELDYNIIWMATATTTSSKNDNSSQKPSQQH